MYVYFQLLALQKKIKETAATTFHEILHCIERPKSLATDDDLLLTGCLTKEVLVYTKIKILTGLWLKV